MDGLHDCPGGGVQDWGGEGRMREDHTLTLKGLSRSLPFIAPQPELGSCKGLMVVGCHTDNPEWYVSVSAKPIG